MLDDIISRLQAIVDGSRVHASMDTKATIRDAIEELKHRDKLLDAMANGPAGYLNTGLAIVFGDGSMSEPKGTA